eukprot:1372189-Prymnesium_polylepis.2
MHLLLAHWLLGAEEAAPSEVVLVLQLLQSRVAAAQDSLVLDAKRQRVELRRHGLAAVRLLALGLVVRASRRAAHAPTAARRLRVVASVVVVVSVGVARLKVRVGAVLRRRAVVERSGARRAASRAAVAHAAHGAKLGVVVVVLLAPSQCASHLDALLDGLCESGTLAGGVGPPRRDDAAERKVDALGLVVKLLARGVALLSHDVERPLELAVALLHVVKALGVGDRLHAVGGGGGLDAAQRLERAIEQAAPLRLKADDVGDGRLLLATGAVVDGGVELVRVRVGDVVTQQPAPLEVIVVALGADGTLVGAGVHDDALAVRQQVERVCDDGTDRTEFLEALRLSRRLGCLHLLLALLHRHHCVSGAARSGDLVGEQGLSSAVVVAVAVLAVLGDGEHRLGQVFGDRASACQLLLASLLRRLGRRATGDQLVVQALRVVLAGDVGASVGGRGVAVADLRLQVDDGLRVTGDHGPVGKLGALLRRQEAHRRCVAARFAGSVVVVDVGVNVDWVGAVSHLHKGAPVVGVGDRWSGGRGG